MMMMLWHLPSGRYVCCRSVICTELAANGLRSNSPIFCRLASALSIAAYSFVVRSKSKRVSMVKPRGVECQLVVVLFVCSGKSISAGGGSLA